MHKVNFEKPSIALKFANFFGVFGYLFTFLAWLWAGGLVAYPLFESGKLDYLLPDTTTTHSPTPTTLQIPQEVTLIIGIIVTIVCFGIMIYALYSLPRTIGKTGSTVTHNAARALVPVVTQKKKVSKKKARTLTSRITNTIKILLIVIPVLVVLLIPEFSALQKNVVLATTAILSVLALFNFGIQLIIAKASKLNPDQIW